MYSFLRVVGLLALAAALVTGCRVSDTGEAESGTSGERVSVGDTEAIVWGAGKQGVVLAYDAESWESQAQTLEENSIVALAVENTSASNLRSAIRFVKDEYGVESVALIGASAGAQPVLQVAESDPEEIGQIIILSGTGEVSGLGEHPKLFVASESEGIADETIRIAAQAPEDQNEALILPGDAHAQAMFLTEEGELLMQAILDRLKEYG